MVFEKRQLALSDWVKGITGFEFAEYGWYVNMYIGLFLLSPLVNKLWNALGSRENHQKIIALVFAIAVLSSGVNAITYSLHRRSPGTRATGDLYAGFLRETVCYK